MNSSTYGTAELQGDASPSSPKSYRLSKVAKIALALIVCGAAAVMAYPSARQATTNFMWDSYSGWHQRTEGSASMGGGSASATSDANANFATILKEPKVPGAMARGHGARRRLRAA